MAHCTASGGLGAPSLGHSGLRALGPSWRSRLGLSGADVGPSRPLGVGRLQPLSRDPTFALNAWGLQAQEGSSHPLGDCPLGGLRPKAHYPVLCVQHGRRGRPRGTRAFSAL